MIITNGDPLRDEAMKSHEENEKDYDEAMKENKEGVDLVSGDNTKKKDGKVKSTELKKMHLSEEIFTELFKVEKLDEGFRDRENTKYIYELVNDVIDPYDMVEMFLNYLSDEEIGRFIEWYTLRDDDEFEEGYIATEKPVDSWGKAYNYFTNIISKYFPNEEKIEKEVDALYEKHRGESAWDEAYKRWCDSDIESDIEESVKGNFTKPSI